MARSGSVSRERRAEPAIVVDDDVVIFGRTWNNRGKAQIIDGTGSLEAVRDRTPQPKPHPSTSADGHDRSHTPIGSPLKQTQRFSTGALPGRSIGSWHDQITHNRFGEQGAEPFTRQRTIVVDPGDRWQLRQVRCIRQHFRKRHSARKLCEENLIHFAVQSTVDWGGWHIVFKQLRVFELVGALFLQRRPHDFRIYDKSGAFIVGVEHKRIWRIWTRLRIKYVDAIAHIHLRFEMRRLEVIVADLEHFPEGQVRTISMLRQICRRQFLPYYLVAQPSIKTIEDLKGKIGANHTVATSADFAIRLGLKSIGLDPDKDVNLRVVGATNLRLIMMQQKQADFTIISTTEREEAEKMGLKVVADLASKKIPYPHAGLISSQKMLKEKRDTMLRFGRATVEAIHYFKNNKPQTLAILKKYAKTDITTLDSALVI